MAHTEEHYRAAAHSLGEGFLSSQFSQSNLDEAEVSRPHRNEAIRENDILLAGDNGPIAGVIKRGAQAAKSNVTEQDKRAKETKRSMDNVLFLNLLEQQSRELGEQITKMEISFEEKYGDAWRETIANQVLDPDEIPQKRDDETIIEYRERLEVVLIDKMIDPTTGKMKPEYSSDPEMREWGQWAEDQVKKMKVDSTLETVNAIEADPNLSTAEKNELTTNHLQNLHGDELRKFKQSDGVNDAAYSAAVKESDSRIDTQFASVDAAANNAVF